MRRAATLDGAIEARVGTADEVPLEGTFEAVVLGFFLYVTDRSLLFKVASEVDRLLSSGESDPARLFILDFDPPFPVVRPYRHHPDLSTWKMNYSQIFLSNPDYRLVERCPILRDGPSEDDLISLYILERVAGSGYRPPGEPSHA